MKLKQLTSLFKRDLDRFKNELEMFPPKYLWVTSGSIENSAGVLAQHTAGNLQHYIGYGMGNTSYQRDRETEFSETGADKNDLIQKLDDAQKAVITTLSGLDDDALKANCPKDFPVKMTNEELLLQLYGHLNYHLGQLNYLRRIFEDPITS